MQIRFEGTAAELRPQSSTTVSPVSVRDITAFRHFLPGWLLIKQEQPQPKRKFTMDVISFTFELS
jgi:hypothetical protein